jgi:DNA-binding NtrC family response regulator
MTTRMALANPEDRAGSGPASYYAGPENSGNSVQRTQAKSSVFFGTHPLMRELQALIKQIGASEAPVLIQGETGVGKEVLAR